MTPRKLVVIESPLAGNRPLHKLYAKACLLDCLVRGEAPYASHLLFDQDDLLDDTVPQQREAGLVSGLAWGAVAELRAFYLDFGESPGMERGRRSATQICESRWLFSPGFKLRPVAEQMGLLQSTRRELLSELCREKS